LCQWEFFKKCIAGKLQVSKSVNPDILVSCYGEIAYIFGGFDVIAPPMRAGKRNVPTSSRLYKMAKPSLIQKEKNIIDALEKKFTFVIKEFIRVQAKHENFSIY